MYLRITAPFFPSTRALSWLRHLQHDVSGRPRPYRGNRPADGVGASGADICRLVSSQALKIMVAGMIFGLVAAEGLRGVVPTYLFGISGRDPLTIAGVCGLLTATTAVSIWTPAIRAIRTDPVRTLRDE